MKYGPQKYVTSTYADAMAAGCGIVQPMYRGIWCRIDVALGFARCYDSREELFATVDVADRGNVCTLIGTYPVPITETPKVIHVWDCWEIGEYSEHWRPERTNLTRFSWRDRFAFANQQVGRLGMPFVVTRNYKIDTAPTVWTNLDDTASGLVYRVATDPVGTVLRVARRYRENPMDLEAHDKLVVPRFQ